MARTARVPLNQKGRAKVPEKKAAVKNKKGSQATKKTGDKRKKQQTRTVNAKTRAVQRDSVESIEDSRRSSDRRKVPVDRYGLTFVFIPKPQPRSPLPSFSSTTKNHDDALSSNSKSVKPRDAVKRKESLRSKASKQQTPSKRSKVKPPSAEPDVVAVTAKKKSKNKKLNASATAKSKKSASKVINAISSKQLVDGTEKPAKRSAGAKKPEQAGKTTSVKKRKNESSGGPKNEKKIKQTIEEVTAFVAGADSETEERQGPRVSAVSKKGADKEQSLKLKPQLKLYFHEPTFESKDELPFVSVPAYSKLAIRAVLINSENLLQRLIDDIRRVHHLNYQRSVDVPYDAATYALLNGNAKLLQIIIDEEKKPKKGRAEPVRSLLEQQATGKYNFHMLGHAVRQIQMSRGGREGINALTKDCKAETNKGAWTTRLIVALQRNVPFRIIQQLQIQNILNGAVIAQYACEAVRYGHNRLAGSIIKEYGDSSFNELHRQVLLNENEPLKPFKAISVKKKGLNNVTPFHCACINPSDKYLAALLAVESDFNHSDKNGYRPVHYAAVCASTGPLNLLLQRGAQPAELTKDGENALHRACAAGRTRNVELILQRCKAIDPELSIAKHKSRHGLTPLHLSAQHGHLEAIKALRKMAGSRFEVDQASGSQSNGVTALMLAAQQGHLPIVEYLIKDAGASATKLDKLKRSALTHAVINGMTHVAAFLLRQGVDPDSADSSGNTPAHYAAAYGWYFCLKILIDAGAKLNSTNDWNLTPLAVAYMKGHMGLADVLLQQAGIDINCRDNQGMTLVASTLAGTVDDATIDQLAYLIEEKGADPKPPDTAGNTPLHLLAVANIETKTANEANADLAVKLAQLLVQHGISVDATNDNGSTALEIAVETGKLMLVKYLAEVGSVVLPDCGAQKNKPNVLHHLVEQITAIQSDKGSGSASPAKTWELDIFTLLSTKQPQRVVDLLQTPNADGLTPFLLAVWKYSSIKESEWKGSAQAKLLNLIRAMVTFCPTVILQRSGRSKSNESNTLEDKAQIEDDIGENESSVDDSDRDKTDEDEESNGSEMKEEEIKFEPTEGRTAFHLLADVHQKKEESQDNVDELVDVLAKHLVQHKDIDSANKGFLDAIDGRGETALFAAVRNRRCSLALHFIGMGCNINAVRRLPPSSRGKDSSKRRSVKESARELKKRRGKIVAPDSVTVLMEAVRVQWQGVINRLLEAGADVSAVDSEGNTALHYACISFPSDAAIVKRLLEAGANVDVRNKKLRTPLHLACNADTGATDVSTETLAYLISYGADPFLKDSHGRLPLHYAFVKIGDHETTASIDPVALCTSLLSRMSANPQSLNAKDAFGCTPLHCAARRGANICCMTFLRYNVVDVNAKDNDGNTPLALAVSQGHMACTLTLLQAQADVDVNVKFPIAESTESADKQLIWAPVRKPLVEKPVCTLSSSVVNQEWQGVVYLLIDIFTKKGTSLLPLLNAAVENRKYNLALTLLRMAKDRPGLSSKAASGYKNLFHLLAENDRPSTSSAVQLQLDVAEAILGIGVPIDEHKDDANGPFHPSFYAAKSRNVPLLRFFIEKGAKTRSLNQYIVSSSGHTVLTMFMRDAPVEGRHDDEWNLVDELIKKHGFSLDVLCRYPLPVDFTATDASVCNYWSSEEALVTPLIHAIHGRNFNTVKNLMKAGANVNFTDAQGLTPLMHAVRVNEPDIVKLLLNSDYAPSNKAPKHGVEIYRQAGEEEDRSTEDSDESETDSDAGKKKPTSKGRLFNVHGSPAIPSSQLSIDGTVAQPSVMHQTAKQNKLNEKETRFFKTTKVDINAVDSDNRNALHHCASSLPTGNWLSNADIAKLLVALGANIETKDRDGLTPMEYAVRRGQSQVTRAITGESDGDSGKIDKNWNVGNRDDGREAVKRLGETVDLEKDANEYLEALRKQRYEQNMAALTELGKKWKSRPHRLSGYSKTGEIVVDCGTGADEGAPTVEPLPYDVLLNKVEINSGLYGFYNFYRMQLIKRKGSELYVLFTNWGRIGDDGQYQKTPFGKLEDAMKEFKSVFRSKTGNDWSRDVRKNFVDHPKKYRLIQQEDDDKLELSAMAIDTPIVLDTPVDGVLPDHIRQFVADVADVKSLASSAKRLFRRSRFGLTLTALKRDAILHADKILNEIGDKLLELEKLRQNAHQKENLDAATKVYSEVCNLSTEFYFLLPLRGFERTRLPVIDELSKWSENKSAIELLLKYEIANRLLCAAAGRRAQVHPYDYVYAATGIRMEQLNADNEEAQMVLHYITNTSDPDDRCKVVAIYKVWNDNQSGKYLQVAEKVGNRWLLWHGTGATNVLSILEGGLLVAPPQALHTGHLFGKGIYAADSFEKSSNYCEQSKTGKRYVFLCEVALGKIARLADLDDLDESVNPLPDGYDSVQGVGRLVPNPSYDFVLKDGVKIPLGKRIPQKIVGKSRCGQWLNQNEFIIYNPKQILLRYMIIFT